MSLGGYEFATNLLRFTYSAITTPEEVWDYDLASRERVLRKRQEIPSGHNSADYVTQRLFAPAADGETIPISLLYRRDVALDGTTPCLLYGYGAYGLSIPAAFGSNRLSIAASSTRSRMCVAAARRAGAGIAKASSLRK